MISSDFEKIERSIKGCCSTSAVTVEHLTVTCSKEHGNEDSLVDTLRGMEFEAIHVTLANGKTLIVRAERKVTT